MSEKTPLLGREKLKKPPPDDVLISPNAVRLKKHIGLSTCIAVIISNVIGSGIFVSPIGVTQNVGSVGATLIVWAVVGFYCLLQALCYAELATVIPKAGGDYAYVYYILGPLVGFMCMWIHVVLACPSANGVIAQTAATYLLKAFGKDCIQTGKTLLASFIIVTFATVNVFSAKLGARLSDFFCLVKLTSVGVIIVIGFVQFGQGRTEYFEQPFSGTETNPAFFALAILDGYFAYKGWEVVMTLPEEMVNPLKDLPRGIVISMIGITTVYVLTNAAYFSVLSTEALLSSDAVALTFAEETYPNMKWFIMVFVALACMGTINGSFLSDTRYLFAAGRFNQLPEAIAMISIKYFTPVLSIVIMCIISLVYCQIPNINMLVEYASLGVQLKILTALMALLFLRYKRPHIHRPIKLPLVIVILVVVFLLALVGFTFYKSPVTGAVGVGLFLLGIPLFFAGEFISKTEISEHVTDTVTIWLQKMLRIVPETRRKRTVTKHFNEMFPD